MRKDLTATTPVVVTREDQEIYAGPAMGFDEITDLFEVAAPEHEAVDDPDPVPTIEPAPSLEPEPGPVLPPISARATMSTPAEAPPEAAAPVPPAPARPVAPPPRPGPLSKSGLWIVGVVAILLLLLSRCGSMFGEDVYLYARAEQAVFDREGGVERARLARGEQVGTRVDLGKEDAVWRRIVSGRHKDLWVRTAWLDTEPRPALEGEAGPGRATGSGVRVREEADPDATVLRALQPNDPVEIVGQTADGWVEVRDIDRGAAYVWSQYVATGRARRR